MGRHVTIEIGERRNRLTVIAADTPKPNGEKRVIVKCDCGTQKTVTLSTFRKDETVSCGCYNLERIRRTNKDRATHGMTNTTEFRVWDGMKARCLNPNHTFYRLYGGRGIYICDRWKESFSNFLADMGPRPEGTTLDRIDNDGPYSPENCRWATRDEQYNNRSTSRFLIVGSTCMSITQWSKKTGLMRKTITERLKRGLTPEQAVATCR